MENLLDEMEQCGVKWFASGMEWKIARFCGVSRQLSVISFQYLVSSFMLIGEYTHTFDDKRRISLPAKFRSALGKKIIVTHGLDSCLFIFSTAQWEKIIEKMQNLSMGQADARAFARHLFAGAADIDIDSLGRILIPEYLTKSTGLTGKAVLIGVHDRLEVWQPDAWSAYKSRVEKEADRLAEGLGAIGLL